MENPKVKANQGNSKKNHQNAIVYNSMDMSRTSVYSIH